MFQSLTIARFLARKCGLAGNNDTEMARADMIVEEVIDIFISKQLKKLIFSTFGLLRIIFDFLAFFDLTISIDLTTLIPLRDNMFKLNLE
jgi:hypothetical protein